MNAFVKTTNGQFPSVNFYLAWKGWTQCNYNVTLFEEKDLDDEQFMRSIMSSTPVFAGVVLFDKILQLKGIPYNKIDTYPNVLQSFLRRNIEKTTLGEFRIRWHKDEENIPQLFMKPVEQKKFTGRIMKSVLDWVSMAHLPDETEVYVSDVLHFESEFRVYIHDQRIITAKHYTGKWDKMIDREIVKDAINTFAPEAPCAYALDFGVDENGKTTLIEFNDATSLGSYGLDAIRYGEMLSDRWFEICNYK